MAKIMRKGRVGAVVGTHMDSTAVVEMVWKQRNRLYRKQVRRVARYKVHDPLNQCQLGDVVRIEETRPISKTKRWRLMEILERRQVAEVRPIELEADIQLVPEPMAPAPQDSIDDEPDGNLDSIADDESDEESGDSDEGEDEADDSDEDSEEAASEPDDGDAEKDVETEDSDR